VIFFFARFLPTVAIVNFLRYGLTPRSPRLFAVDLELEAVSFFFYFYGGFHRAGRFSGPEEYARVDFVFEVDLNRTVSCVASRALFYLLFDFSFCSFMGISCGAGDWLVKKDLFHIGAPLC